MTGKTLTSRKQEEILLDLAKAEVLLNTAQHAVDEFRIELFVAQGNSEEDARHFLSMIK